MAGLAFPDLGSYAPYVLAAWGVVTVALIALGLHILGDARRLKRTLAKLEADRARRERER